ncbi:MAG: histidine--tRNA ligase, partial [Ignavibacteriales bacterium]|nr:histidine--tRNA ligase [Ignavibacteriales bacterium]
KGITVEVDYLARSLKAQMREANRQQVKYVIVIGENELNSDEAKLKNMSDGTEATVRLNELAAALQ